MNYLKNEINNNKLIPNLRNKSEKVKKTTYLSDPNLDIDNANNKQNKKTTNNYIKKNRKRFLKHSILNYKRIPIKSR